MSQLPSNARYLIIHNESTGKVWICLTTSPKQALVTFDVKQMGFQQAVKAAGLCREALWAL